MVEMVYKTKNGSYFSTLEEAEQAERNEEKIIKMKEKMQLVFDCYKSYNDDAGWVMYDLNDVAEYLVEHFDKFQEIMKDDK